MELVRVSGKDSIPLLKDNTPTRHKKNFFLFGQFFQNARNGEFIKGLMKIAVRAPFHIPSLNYLKHVA